MHFSKEESLRDIDGAIFEKFGNSRKNLSIVKLFGQLLGEVGQNEKDRNI